MSGQKTVIIDYGMGNLFSIQRSICSVGGEALVTDDPKKILEADRVILPGVGAFENAMNELRSRKLIDAIQKYADSGKPILGICLGMQMLFSESSEFGDHKGLDLIKGKVMRLDHKDSDDFKVPQIGWNRIAVPRCRLKDSWDGSILDGIEDGSFFYFVHSYKCEPDDMQTLLAETVYGRDTFCSAVKSKNIWGCQFHPERSGPKGLRLYKNFLSK